MTKYCSVIFFLFICYGCKDSPSDNNTQTDDDLPFTLPKDSVVVSDTPLNSHIVFSFTESISPSGRPIEFLFNTVDLYNGGRNLVGELTQNGLRISVRIDSITTNGGGPGGKLPGVIRFKIGSLSNNLYAFTITVNGKNIQSLLLVTDTSYIVTTQPNNFVSSTRPRLLRVPKNIIWGQAESYTPTLYQECLDSIIVAGAKPYHIQNGDYIFFKIFSADSFYAPNTIGRKYGTHFVYEFNSDTLITRNIVKSFGKKYGDPIYVDLFGGRGELFYSDVLRREP